MNKTFPYLETKGNYEEVGTSIGTRFKERLQNYILKRKRTIPNYDQYIEQTRPYFDITQKYFPHLIGELDSIAKAAEISLQDLFFVNNREVFESFSLVGHCTIAVSFGSDGAIVGHNEDWAIEELDDLYVLKATIGETTFLGLQYFEALGVSATMNNWGLVQCINDLSGSAQIGVPKNFIARAILECKTLDEAEDIIRKTPNASGFNHVLVQGDEIRNIEISGNDIAVEKVLKKNYVHTNHFLSLEMQTKSSLTVPSSIPRYNRAKELIRDGMTRKDMIELLSDKGNREFPICRQDETIGSVICIPKLNEVWICYDNPAVGEFKKYTL